MYNARNFWDTLNLNDLDILFWYNERMAVEKTTSIEFGTIAPFLVFLEAI